MQTPLDAIVIGSGPGGLTAAVALARAKQRVLVLEQHYLPGGWTHSFSLDGYRFSPGVHYIGDVHEGGGVRRLYEGLGVARDLEFCELNPEGFDHFLIAGERFDQPKGLDRWVARLTARFPHEREGIARYFATMRRLVDDVKRCDTMLEFPAVLAVPFRAPTLVRWGLRTLSSLLDACVRDPTLKAVLSAQAGNHGLAPSRVSLPIHCTMSSHYFDGGYYPRGGASRIPRAFIRELRRNGGEIRTRARVARVLVESGRAVGVELASGEVLRARTVISNADPAVTYGRLVPEAWCAREARKARRMEYSVSLLSVFCATDLDLEAMGYDSGNYWWYRTADVDGLYARMERALPGPEVDGLFLTITTLKDPTHRPHGHHTIEMFTFAPYEPFARWAGTRQGERGDGYERLKRDLGERMLAAAENVIPGLRGRLRFLEVGTALTNDFYCESVRGAAYGTAKTPWQLGPFSFSQRGPVDGLYLCGSSTLSHGVAGASMSGLVAAQYALGLSSVDALLDPADGSLTVLASEAPAAWPPGAREVSQGAGRDAAH